MVAVEGIEPTSLEYQSSALAVELHRETWLTRRGSNPHLTAYKAAALSLELRVSSISDFQFSIADWTLALEESTS